MLYKVETPWGAVPFDADTDDEAFKMARRMSSLFDREDVLKRGDDGVYRPIPPSKGDDVVPYTPGEMVANAILSGKVKLQS